MEIIHQAADIRHDDDQETVSRKLGALLESVAGTNPNLDELRTMAVALANVVGAPTTPRGTYTATDISKGELHWGLRRILELGAHVLPVILVFEDLHWAEPSLIELIESIFDSESVAPVLAIATGRPEFREVGAPLFAASSNRRIIELDALTDDAARGIITELLGVKDIPQDVVDQLLRAAGGNPLFLEEIAQMWLQSGENIDSLEQSDLPSGLQALIASRLDRLPTDERRLLTHASVIGEVFWSGAVSHLEGGYEFGGLLESLERRDLIRSHPGSTVSGQHEYAFKHGLIRDAAYGRLTKAERAQLHQRCGEWIGGLPEGENEFAEIIAYHLEQACLITSDLALTEAMAPMLRAADALRRAGDKAERRQGLREAERFLSRAISLLGDQYPETTIDLKFQRAMQLNSLGQTDEAQASYLEVAAGALTLNRVDLRCRALLGLTELLLQQGNAADAREYLDESDRLARETADPHLRVRATWARAWLHEVVEGPTAVAIEALQSAVALAEEVDDRRAILTARLRLGAVFFNKGELGPAQVQFERCMELAQQQGSLRIQSWVTGILALIRFHCGPRDDVDDLYTRAADWTERTNDKYMQAQIRQWHAASALDRGDVGRALRLLRDAERTVSLYGGSLAVRVERFLAEALARQGRVAETREVAARAKEHAPEEDALAQADTLVAQAFAAAAAGDESGARSNFAQALPMLDNRGNAVDLGEARLSFARLLESFGDLNSAQDQLDRARDLFEKVGAGATVIEIEGELARLRDLEIGSSRAGVSPDPA
jgi:tetratricopeptide (TPR) repeat protein